MNSKKTKIIIASLAAALVAGGALTMAFLTDKTITLENLFEKGKKYTLTYHANTESAENDGKVSGLPEEQTEYGDGTTAVTFTVSTDKPTRPGGFVFKKWTEGKSKDSTAHEGGSNWTVPLDQDESNLYAQWAPGYTLIYDANRPAGAKGGDAPGMETRESDAASETFDVAGPGDMNWIIEVDGAETDEYRVFLGWSEDPEADEPTYTDTGKWAYTGTDYDGDNSGDTKQTITINQSDNNKTKILYAVWANRYELKYELHPEMTDPASEGPVPKTQTCVSRDESYTFHIPKRVEVGKEGPGEVANAPSRKGGYDWGWWGDSLDRYGYIEGGSNEGCYLFNEDFPDHHTKDKPTWTLYAYFRPPTGVWVYYYDNAYVLDDEFNPKTGSANQKLVDPTSVDFKNIKSPVGTVSTDLNVPVELTEKIPEHPKYEFLGWSRDPDATDPDTFDNNRIWLDKRKSNVARLYAVWQHKHKFRVSFNKNTDVKGASSTYGTHYSYYINPANGKWTYSNGTSYYEKNGVRNTESGYYLDDSFTFDKAFFDDKGIFATRPEDDYGSYKFVGWSYTNYPTRGEDRYEGRADQRVEFPIELPDDPASLYNQLAEGNVGKIQGSIKAEEEDPPCTAPKTHEVKLYAVWLRSPLHNFSLKFERNDSTETLSRGTSTSSSFTYAYPADYSNPRITRVRALDEPSYTWRADSWTGDNTATTCPIVKKSATDTATYEFIGWSKQKNKTSLDNDDYSIDETTQILNEPIKLGHETVDEARDCSTATHSMTLYPVFKPVPRHKYAVYFDVNQPASLSMKGIETKLYQKKSDGTWITYTRDKDTLKWDNTNIKSYGNKTDIEGVSRSTSAGTIEFTEIKNSGVKSLSWPSDYTSADPLPGNGLYASCENKNATSSTEYKFVGWSYTRYTITGNTRYIPGESTLEFPVVTPADGGDGTIDSVVIDIDESDPTSQHACTEAQGKVHNRVLYGVWTGEVLHQYSVTFDGNGAGSKVLYGSADDWTNGTTKDDSKQSDGKCINYSEPKKPAKQSDADDDKYTFEASYWTEKDVIAKAERTTGDGYEYTFAGWSLDPNASPEDTDKIISVDGTIPKAGYITDDIEVDCDKYPCDGSTVHDVGLYAVWNKRAVHRYSVIFYNDGSSGSVQTKSGSTWSNAAISVGKSAKDAQDLGLTADLKNCYRNISDYKYLDTPAAKSHTWAANTLAVRGVKKSTETMEYTFVGWATSPVEPSTEWTRSSDVIALHINDDGDIIDPISFDEPDTLESCQYDTHNKVYYPVFRMDPIHKFTIQFNYNGGNGIRYRSGQSWTYTTSSTRSYTYGPKKLSETGSSYTWSKDEFWANEGIGAYKNTDAFYSYEFVGWSKTKQNTPIDAVPADTLAWIDDPNSTAAGAGYINEDITVDCPDPCLGGNHPTVNYYAVWRATPLTKTYNLKFNGNDASNPNITNVPGDIMDKTETYNDGGTYKGGTWKGYDFTMPAEVPVNKKMVFTGWSTDPNDTQGEYGYVNNKNEQIAELTSGLKNTYHMKTGESTYEATKTETMHAIWWYEFYLEYEANGGSQAPPLARTYKSSDAYSFPLDKNIPARNGYEFLGWATSPDAIDPEYQPEELVPLTACTDPASDDYGYAELILYAVWKLK